MAWHYTGQVEFCPLCRKDRKVVKISWMHHWPRCGCCLLKLPPPKHAKQLLAEKKRSQP